MEQKSTFVTVVAWIFIVLSGLGLLIFAMYTALIWMLPFDQLMQQGAVLNPNQPQLSATIMTALVRWMFVVLLMLQTWMLVSSIGLLLRKNWARISFIVILVIGLAWIGINTLFAILALVGIHSIVNMGALPGMPAGFQSFLQVIMIISVVFNTVLMVLFGWILKKLVSEDIRKEFVKPADKPGALAA